MRSSRWEATLAGSGGQGLITAGIILAEAAVLAGLNAVQTQSYGPESRGGATRAEVVIADGEIDYPKVTNPDALLVLTSEAHRRYGRRLKEGGLLVADLDLVGEVPSGPYRLVRVPITRIAREELGREIVANIVALGVLAALTHVVPTEALERAVLERVPAGTEELNRLALGRGMEAGRQAEASGTGPAERG
ncbi:MAG: 2-oxoacid:ferredoxin oxidoreductase subunit gamma [Armatimonadetes bacterium]|nr:2-oxoacid:ferredoxin oxidoreductase subunit gamma [Armatimonadota bacterium]